MNGQTQMASMELMPWAILFARMGRTRLRLSLAAGAVLATQLLAGAVYPMVITSVALGMDFALALVLTRGAELATFSSYALTLVSAPAYAAVKLVPVLDFLRDHRRPISLLQHRSRMRTRSCCTVDPVRRR